MISTKLRSLALLTFIMLFADSVYGSTQFRVLSGTKSQSFNGEGQIQLGTSPLGLLTFIDFEVMRKTYMSFGTSFEMNTGTMSTSGFTIYGSAMYYLYGYPKSIDSSTDNVSMDLFYPYTAYVSFGVFQKQLKVRPENSAPDSTIDSTEDVGGLSVGGGFNYNFNKKIYLASHIQMLMSGATTAEYSSTELYIGLGIRL